MVGEREHLGPGDHLAGEHHDRPLDAVRIEVVQRKIGEATVFGGADAVLAARSTPVPHFQISELTAAGVGGKRC